MKFNLLTLLMIFSLAIFGVMAEGGGDDAAAVPEPEPSSNVTKEESGVKDPASESEGTPEVVAEENGDEVSTAHESEPEPEPQVDTEEKAEPEPEAEAEKNEDSPDEEEEAAARPEPDASKSKATFFTSLPTLAGSMLIGLLLANH